MVTITRNELEKTVGHVSQIAFKHWLKVHEFPHTAINTEDFYELLSKLLTRKDFSFDKLCVASLEIEENGGKRIYLKKLESLDLLKDKDWFSEHLSSQKLGLADKPTASIKFPKEPTINYIFWSTQGIRIKATETHIKLDINIEKRMFNDNKVTKFVLALLDFDTGFLQIRLDSPDDVHSHKNANGESDPQEYEDYYFRLFNRILGVQNLISFDLGGIAEKMVTADPRIFRLPVELVRTGANSRQRYSCRDDVRDDPARQGAAAVDGANWVYEDLNGYWIPDQSDGNLQRELFMQINRRRSMIRFLADCLASEVDYALSRIRSLSN